MTTESITVLFGPSELAALDARVAQGQTSREQVIRRAVREFFDREDAIDRSYVEAYTRDPQPAHGLEPWEE